MNETNVYSYVQRYLQAMNCHIIEQSDSLLQAKLSVAADQDIGNRPYFWMYAQQMTKQTETLTLTFSFHSTGQDTNPEAEQMTQGVPRLQQMYASAKKRGKYVRLIESAANSPHYAALHPWLYTNYKISLISDRKKDWIASLGFQLNDGQIIADFEQLLQTKTLSTEKKETHNLQRITFSLPFAVQQLQAAIRKQLDEIDHSWANEANHRLDEEIQCMHAFYGKADDDQRTLKRRTQEINTYRPAIKVTCINVGLVYLFSLPKNMRSASGSIPNQ